MLHNNYQLECWNLIMDRCKVCRGAVLDKEKQAIASKSRVEAVQRRSSFSVY